MVNCLRAGTAFADSYAGLCTPGFGLREVLIASPLLKNNPIGSMYAIYGNIYHQYTPFMLAYIPAPWILWVTTGC